MKKHLFILCKNTDNLRHLNHDALSPYHTNITGTLFQVSIAKNTTVFLMPQAPSRGKSLGGTEYERFSSCAPSPTALFCCFVRRLSSRSASEKVRIQRLHCHHGILKTLALSLLSPRPIHRIWFPL